MTVTEQTLFRVSFAVQLRDDFSGWPSLIDETNVFIKESGQKALQNPSGYSVFTGVTETKVTIRIENKYYFPEEANVDIPTLDPRNPVAFMTMKPNCLYPFPEASTLMRGVVLDTGNHPVKGAAVSAAGSAVTNLSEADGRFVLYWGPLQEDDISVVNHRRYLKIGGGTTIQINVHHPSFQPKTLPIGTMVEGELTLLTTAIVLNP